MSESESPNGSLEDNTLLEHVEESGELHNASFEPEIAAESASIVDAEVIVHGKFDDAADDFAYENESDDESDKGFARDEFSDKELTSEELDDDEPDEEFVDAEFDIVDETNDNADIEADNEFEESASEGDSNDEPKPRRQPKFEVPIAATFEPQRLAKILAAAGIDARRKCEDYVTTGRVTVDGKTITDLAFRADPFTQKVALDGERVRLQRKVYFALNKPKGVLCTNHDPAGRPRVMDLFPQFKERLFAIGRLDEESEGLLLVTNDGELANRLAHPRYRIPKFYLCHVKGVPTSETLASLKRGMYFEEGRFCVEGVRLKKAAGDSAYLDIILNEGQNREIRRLMAKVGHKVMKLKRVGFGPIRLGTLPRGAFRQLSVDEIRLLKQLCEQRAYLDSTVSRDRKPRSKKFGGGPKPGFQKRPPRQFSTENENVESNSSFRRKEDLEGPSRQQFQSRPPTSQRPSQGTVRPPRGRFVDAAAGAFDGGSGSNGQRQYGGPPRQGEANRRPQGGAGRPQRGQFTKQGGESNESNTPSGGQRRYDGPSRQGGANRRPQAGAARPHRRQLNDEGGESFASNTQSAGQRRFGGPPRQGGASRRPHSGAARPPQRRQFNDEGGESFASNTQSGGQRRYGGPPRQGGTSSRPQGGAARPQRRQFNDEGGESFDSNSQSGGQRRYGGPPRRAGTNRRPQEGANRSQRRFLVSDDPGTRSTNQGPQGQGNFSGGQSRYGGNRPVGQKRFPQRGQRGERRPPQIQVSADGKEILEGNVTGFRSVPKEGRARRPMTGQRTFNSRQKRIQRRRKAEE